ncbi:MAG: NADH-quinone oxidoreductase subunit J [Bryobacteraceae bacterium]
MNVAFFFLFATAAVLSAVSLVVQRHPISSAMSLIGVMISLACLYLQLGGEFIATAQLIVYAGAIMVLFVFVIMLLNAGTAEGVDRRPWLRWLGIPMIGMFLAVVASLAIKYLPFTENVRFGDFTVGTTQLGSAQSVGLRLFKYYVLPFEATSILILIAIFGAIVLARKEIE